MKTIKILYWISISLFGLSILSGAGLYFFNYQHAFQEFSGLGFPTWLIYPLAVAKILGILLLFQRKNNTLKEWAFAGFFFNLLLAFGAHLMINDGEAFGPVLVMLFMFASYYFDKRINNAQEH